MKKEKYGSVSVKIKTQKAVRTNAPKHGMTQSEYVDRAVTDFERNAKLKARRKVNQKTINVQNPRNCNRQQGS